MEPPVDIQAEERMLGRWPRRLLHVPSMTSLEWSEGNFYGTHQNPQYYAITYTWGRWRLQDTEDEHLSAINIHGVPWDIPRVKPECFTADELLAVLQYAIKYYPKFSGRQQLSHFRQGVEFVWFDIACIDQRPNKRRPSSEIGRQADIFQGAAEVFLWLARTSTATLKDSYETLDRLSDEVFALIFLNHTVPPKTLISSQLLSSVLDSLQRILADPWFSSLWTLQEAFLRQDAIVLGKEARVISNLDPHSGIESDVILQDLIHLCVSFGHETMGKLDLPHPSDQLIELVYASGLSHISANNPLVTYTASSQRKCIKDEDRVYGIQQIFGFRLGASSPLAEQGTSFSRKQLEIELGQQLLYKHSILSQLHVFTEPVELGEGWFVDRKSKVPDDVPGRTANAMWVPEDDRPQCSLTTYVVGDTTWGYFEGLAVKFSVLKVACEKLKERRDAITATVREAYETEDDGTRISETLYLVAHLDARQDSPRLPKFRQYDEYQEASRQSAVASWLLETFGDNIQVSLLGSRTTGSFVGHSNTRVFGLLSIPQSLDGIQFDRRIGFCW